MGVRNVLSNYYSISAFSAWEAVSHKAMLILNEKHLMRHQIYL